jgi:DEAD/DEAH box helicase domain-containing protein
MKNIQRPDVAGASTSSLSDTQKRVMEFLSSFPDSDTPTDPHSVRHRPMIYLDLELATAASSKGTWNLSRARMSVAVTYTEETGELHFYKVAQLPALIDRLRSSDIVVGFNILGFDLQVIQNHGGKPLPRSVKVLDLMVEVQNSAKRRISLDALIEANFGHIRPSLPQDEIKWWRQGQQIRVAERCCNDVLWMRRLHQIGAKRGFVFARDRFGQKPKVPVKWKIADVHKGFPKAA